MHYTLHYTLHYTRFSLNLRALDPARCTHHDTCRCTLRCTYINNNNSQNLIVQACAYARIHSRVYTRAHTHPRTQAARLSPRLRRGCAACDPHPATMCPETAALQVLNDTQNVAKLRHGSRCILKVPAKLQIVAKKFARLKDSAYICRRQWGKPLPIKKNYAIRIHISKHGRCQKSSCIATYFM